MVSVEKWKVLLEAAMPFIFVIGCFVGAAIYKFLTEYPKKKK